MQKPRFLDPNHTPPVPLIDQVSDLGFHKLADSYIDLLEKRKEEVAFCIGYSSHIDESYELFVKIHDSLDNESLRDVAKGCIESNNLKLFTYLLQNTKFDSSNDSLLFSESLYMRRHEISALLLTHNCDISPLTYRNSRDLIKPTIEAIPSSTPEIERRWYSCLPSIITENNADFIFACSALKATELPKNLLKLIMQLNNVDMSMTLIKSGFDYDSISRAHDDKTLPELQSKYLKYLTDSKLDSPTIRNAPAINF